jgi:hypothetical protein
MFNAFFGFGCGQVFSFFLKSGIIILYPPAQSLGWRTEKGVTQYE